MRELGSLSISSLSGIGEGSFWEQWFWCVHSACAWTKYAPQERKKPLDKSHKFLGRKLGLQAKVRADDTGWNTKNVLLFWTLTSTALWQVKEVRQKRQMLYDLSYMWNPKEAKNSHKTNLQEKKSDLWLPEMGQMWGWAGRIGWRWSKRNKLLAVR